MHFFITIYRFFIQYSIPLNISFTLIYIYTILFLYFF